MKNISLEQVVYDCVNKHQLIDPGSIIIIGLSGGPDSVFLLHMLCKLQKQYDVKLVAAYLDHGWRSDSEGDVVFCQKRCKDLGVAFVSKKLSDFSDTIKANGSQEAYARAARRMFFEQLAHEYNANAIALGHHADDQKETFFIRLIRGASVAGLCGMRYKYGRYIRPLLDCRKSDIEEYLETHGIVYLTDSTNTSDDFLRNRIRNTLLPAFDAVDDRAHQNILHSMNQLKQADEYMHMYMQKIWQSIATLNDSIWYVDSEQLLAQPVSMRYRLITHWLVQANVVCTPTQRFFAEIERFLQTKGSKSHQMHQTWSIIKCKHVVHIKQNEISKQK